MEGIPVYYVMQPSVDDTLNVFFLPPQFRSQSDVKIQDVVTNFPHKGNGKFYHFRFYAICDKDQKTWVDISNLTAKAPVVDGRILVKILELSKPQHTKIFASVYGAAPSQPTTQQQRPQEQAPQRPNPPQQQQPQNPAANQARSPQYQQQQQQPAPQRPANVQPQSPPQNSSAHDFDLLGNDNVINMSASTATSTNRPSAPTFMHQSQPQAQNMAPPRQDNSHLQGMTRDQLSAYKDQQKADAIQEKLDFFKKVRDEEEKTQNEKAQAYTEVEDIIKKWAGKDKQRNNIRALLCTLQDVVWVESGWTALSFSDLMQPAQIKKNYFKAITRFHPDKNQTADYRQKYIAERVTNELNAAWDEFRKTNP